MLTAFPETWHPLGRVTGGTLYPGLMVTSGAIYHSGLHLPISRWKLRQRSNCHLPTRIHLLPMDKVGQEWLRVVGSFDGAVLRIHGLSMGWIRLHHKPAPIACLRAHLHGTFQPSALRGLHHLVRSGDIGQHADTFRGLHAHPQ